MDAKQFIAGLPAWDGCQRVLGLLKEQLLDAEVSLPAPEGFTGVLVAVRVRRPYRAQIELIAVDVSRLPAS